MKKRLEALEAAQRAWEADHVPMRDVSAFLLDVLTVVQEHAGQKVMSNVAGKLIRHKFERIEALKARL